MPDPSQPTADELLEAELAETRSFLDAERAFNKGQATKIKVLEAEVERLRLLIHDVEERTIAHEVDCKMPTSWAPGDNNPLDHCTCGVARVMARVVAADSKAAEEGRADE